MVTIILLLALVAILLSIVHFIFRNIHTAVLAVFLAINIATSILAYSFYLEIQIYYVSSFIFNSILVLPILAVLLTTISLNIKSKNKNVANNDVTTIIYENNNSNINNQVSYQPNNIKYVDSQPTMKHNTSYKLNSFLIVANIISIAIICVTVFVLSISSYNAKLLYEQPYYSTKNYTENSNIGNSVKTYKFNSNENYSNIIMHINTSIETRYSEPRFWYNDIIEPEEYMNLDEHILWTFDGDIIELELVFNNFNNENLTDFNLYILDDDSKDYVKVTPTKVKYDSKIYDFDNLNVENSKQYLIIKSNEKSIYIDDVKKYV